MHMGVNLSAKKHKVRLGDEITLNTLGVDNDMLLTKRIMVSQIYSLYDPLGLLSPITIKYKLLLQQLVQMGIGWDDPLPAEVQKSAKSVLREIVETQDVSFHRSVVPARAKGEPQLVGFWDGGRPASAACLHDDNEDNAPFQIDWVGVQGKQLYRFTAYPSPCWWGNHLSKGILDAPRLFRASPGLI